MLIVQTLQVTIHTNIGEPMLFAEAGF